MSELNLEAIRRKAQNAITATDKEWAQVVSYLLNRVSELEAELERTYEKIDEQGFSSILMDDPWPGEEYSSF